MSWNIIVSGNFLTWFSTHLLFIIILQMQLQFQGIFCIHMFTKKTKHTMKIIQENILTPWVWTVIKLEIKSFILQVTCIIKCLKYVINPSITLSSVKYYRIIYETTVIVVTNFPIKFWVGLYLIIWYVHITWTMWIYFVFRKNIYSSITLIIMPNN